ncbi:MAG: hypothetical protein WEB58_04160 [Planctomycetaceae bacterium]
MDHITYDLLFAYLRELGFTDTSPSDHERVFEHREQGIVLAVSMLDDPSENRVARDADVLSVQFRLREHGLLDGNLVDVANQRVRKF